MASHEVILSGAQELAQGTMAFWFSKPAGFAFKPGQSISLELIDPPAESNSTRRIFSLASAPFEPRLMIATRMREESAFKRALKALPASARVRLQGPVGSFALHDDVSRPAVFVAGGIGITPFMSILRQAARDRLPQRLLLAYSNRRPEDAAFLAELQEMERGHANFRLFATMTEMTKSTRKWDGATGMVDAEFLKGLAAGVVAPVYYVVGPPAMVAAMQEALRQTGVAEDDVRTEEFYGY